MSRSENLPVLPQAVSTILRLADDPDVSQKEMERAFERDPAIAAKILKVANSAYYGGVHIPTIGRAISFLGATTIRSLVISIAFQQMSTGRAQSPSFNILEYWKHSLAVGVASRILGKLKLPGKAEELYCCGMLHDIGLLVLDRFMPEELELALQQSRQNQCHTNVTEKETIGFDHTEVGALLAEKWKLSPLTYAGIRYHHSPNDAKDYQTAALLVGLANELAYLCGYKNQLGEAAPGVNPEMLQALELPSQQIEIILQVIKAEVVRTQESFRLAA